MSRCAKGYIDPLMAIVIAIVVILAVIVFHSYFASAILQSSRAAVERRQIYEFVRCFNREVEASDDITAADDGQGLVLTFAESGTTVEYQVIESSSPRDDLKGKYGLYANGTKILDVAGAEFGFDGDTAYVSVQLSKDDAFQLYSVKRRNALTNGEGE